MDWWRVFINRKPWVTIDFPMKYIFFCCKWSLKPIQLRIWKMERHYFLMAKMAKIIELCLWNFHSYVNLLEVLVQNDDPPKRMVWYQYFFLYGTSWCHTDIDPFLSGRNFFVSLRDEVNMACSQSQVLRLFSISDPLVPWGEVVSLQKPNPQKKFQKLLGAVGMIIKPVREFGFCIAFYIQIVS